VPTLWQYAIHTQEDDPAHLQFWKGMQDSLTPQQLAAIAEGGPLREKAWKARPVAPPPPVPAVGGRGDGPYYSQRDSRVPGQANRMCFSSSNAMALKALKPNLLGDGPNGDDEYLKVVMRYGDTTLVESQLQALRHFGVKPTFTEHANWNMLLEAASKRAPNEVEITLGFLHKGHVLAPYGGGHWLYASQVAADHLIVNDPFGEIDLVNGGYPSSNGKQRRYSRRNFEPRWSVKLAGGRYVAAPNCGYAMLIAR
jgi:hypothetical protein